ncbi:MAG: FAD-dependent oxidoreductase [Cellulomonadaceae bacterium]|nr:FAD-dependent oxidoreductase [Cellulomonadaceae bacterium]
MKIVIVGGSHAAIACALRAREEYPDATVVMYEKQDTIGFVAQSIPLYLQGKSDFQKVRAYVTVRDLVEKGIAVHTEVTVRKVNIADKTIEYADKKHAVHTDSWDKLVMATGSYPTVPVVKGDFDGNVFIIKKFDDAVKIKKMIAVAKSVVVIGGGAIGVEIARLLVQQDLEVTLVQSHEQLMNRYLDDELANEVKAVSRGYGIDVRTGSVVSEIEVLKGGPYKNRRLKVTTSDGKSVVADGVIYATGFRPNSFLVHKDVQLGPYGAIVVDDYMQTSVPDVFAVGDCATTRVTNVAEPKYMPHASNAVRQGGVCALNLMGPRKAINPSQGTYNMNFDGRIMCMTGLSQKRATEEGFDAMIAHVVNKYIASDKFYEMWLVFEKGTHKILGLQARGTSQEVSSYADLLSMAIEQNLTIDDIEYTDFYFKHGYEDPRGFTKVLADAVRRMNPKENA